MSNEATAQSGYLQYLPAIFSEDPFLGQFLLAFEEVLTGYHGAQEPGLEEMIAGMAAFFDPRQTREDFLPWLAGWAAFSLRADWTLEQQRNFLADVVPLYRTRGTKENLIELLRLYTIGAPTIDEGEITTLQIGVRSRIGVDTLIGEPPTHFFRVRITLEGTAEPAVRDRQLQIARALIDLQKPAHTSYEVKISSNTMKLGASYANEERARSTIGKDTLIGDEAVDDPE
ncbi:MAG TPA: phage tail protein [Blastocatellia bacterium]|nr:phage tail protein [Blastocatellia bacterium]